MRTTKRSRGVEPLEQRVCLSAGQPLQFHFAYSTGQHVQQSHEHHYFTAMSRSDVFAGGMMMGGTMTVGVRSGEARMAPPPALGDAIAKALEQLARQMMKEMQQGEAGEHYSGIRKDSVTQPDNDAGGSYVISDPEPVNSGTIAEPATGTVTTNPSKRAGNQTNQSNVIVTTSTRPIEATRVTAVAVLPKARVAGVTTGGRAIEILETTSAVATRAAAGGVSTMASIGAQASSAARELWTIVTGGGETTVGTPATGNVIATANPAAAMAARATNAIAPNVSVPKLFEFAHLGSPMTLLADSMAGFIEDSAAIPVAIGASAQAHSQLPWLITASVIAADVVLLTYMHRRRKQSRSMAVSAMHY